MHPFPVLLRRHCLGRDPWCSPYLLLFSSVLSLSRVRLFATPWTVALEGSMSITTSQSLPKLMSIESLIPSNHLMLCHTFSSCLQSPRVRSSVQCSSVAQSCPTLCDPMNSSTPGFPVHHQLPELTQTHVHQDTDSIQPSHPLSSPSPTFSLSQRQGLFQ